MLTQARTTELVKTALIDAFVDHHFMKECEHHFVYGAA